MTIHQDIRFCESEHAPGTGGQEYRPHTRHRQPSVDSDTQAYKQAGNAVTVNVIHALGLRLKAAHAANIVATGAEKEAA